MVSASATPRDLTPAHVVRKPIGADRFAQSVEKQWNSSTGSRLTRPPVEEQL